MRQFSSTNGSALIGARLLEKKEFDFIKNLVGKFGKLTKHYHVAKKQAEFFKQLKENLQVWECAIVLDFAEKKPMEYIESYFN